MVGRVVAVQPAAWVAKVAQAEQGGFDKRPRRATGATGVTAAMEGAEDAAEAGAEAPASACWDLETPPFWPRTRPPCPSDWQEKAAKVDVPKTRATQVSRRP